MIRKTQYHREGDTEILREYAKKQGASVAVKAGSTVYAQGDPADSVYFIAIGRIQLGVVSLDGKEAVIGISEACSFFGEACIVGQQTRLTSAVAMSDCELFRFEKAALIEQLNSDTKLANIFITHLVSRTVRLEEDIVDHLFNSSEKRLARVLLLLAHYGNDHPPTPIKPKISHEMLAEMIGTTRPRVTQFMNKFRKLGFIHYNDSIEVHNSLLTVLLQNSTTED